MTIATIEQWKLEEVESFMQYLEDMKTVIKDMMSECETMKERRAMRESIRFQQIPKYVHELLMWGEVDRREKVTNIVNNHFAKLEAKATKRVGELTGVETITNRCYYLVGEEGKCVIEIIDAGGWNIQRKHVRWIFK